MPPRIAIPIPHSMDREYSDRALPQYERAVTQAGGEPVRIPLDQTGETVKAIVASCAGVLLPGSKADIDPARFDQPPSPHAAAADARREAVDNLLLEHAYRQHKPVLGICYGLQSLNVYRRGSLVQHIPDFLPEVARAKVDHEAGKSVSVAHTVKIESESQLAEIVSTPSPSRSETGVVVAVNSSHHQSVDSPGAGLRIVARCPDDGIVEALEGTLPDHFVLAVQWHPERAAEHDESARAIFRALVQATRIRTS